jgi:hypothetical protein
MAALSSGVQHVAVCVWALMSEDTMQHMAMTIEPSAKNWLFTMMETLSREAFVEMAVTLWAIWYARRRLIRDGEQQSPLSTFLLVRRFIDVSKWLAPLEGYVKINVDAACYVQNGWWRRSCSCLQERNWRVYGCFCSHHQRYCSALTISDIGSPAALEALTYREALALAQDLNVRSVCIATNCLEVANNIERPYFGEYGMVIQKIKETMSLFMAVSFRHEN